jgi:hypothetical protein
VLSDLDNDLATFETACQVRPLVTWRAWDQPPPRTSQRRTLGLLTQSREVGIFGGNRSGKTEMARAALVAVATGSDHPDARAFWELNGVDPDHFPTGPDSGWAIAVSSNDSLRYHRRQILSLIPKWGPKHPNSDTNSHSWNLFGRGEARLQWMVPGYDTPAEIWFKSEDQDIMTFQGDAIRVAWHDEEGLTAKRYEQVQYRLIDKDGWQILTDTPIHGRTWVYNRFYLKQDSNRKPIPDGAIHTAIHTADNPYLPRHRVARIANDAVRGRGEFVVMEGRIWPEFGPLHQLAPFELPPDALRFRSIDFGTRHPFACLNGAILRTAVTLPNGRRLADGSIIIYREHYQAEQTLEHHVRVIREAEGWHQRPASVQTNDKKIRYIWVPKHDNAERIEATWADPEDAQQMLQINRDHDMEAIPATKDIHAGISALRERLMPDPSTGEPSLYVFTTCTNTIREWEDFQWVKQITAEGIEKDVPSKRSDHTCDCGRYLVMGVNAGY